MTDLSAVAPTISRTITTEATNARVEIFPLALDGQVLKTLITELFDEHWSIIHFGVMVPGAIYEIKAPNKPDGIRYNGGYMTIDFGAWHFHLCIGDYPCSNEDGQVRQTARAEFYRMVNKDDQPMSWGFRMYNGADQQQLVVFMPNPRATPDNKLAEQPDWSRLALWDQLRQAYLGLPFDPIDRTLQDCKNG